MQGVVWVCSIVVYIKYVQYVHVCLRTAGGLTISLNMDLQELETMLTSYTTYCKCMSVCIIYPCFTLTAVMKKDQDSNRFSNNIGTKTCFQPCWKEMADAHDVIITTKCNAMDINICTWICMIWSVKQSRKWLEELCALQSWQRAMHVRFPK